jgi:starvation-inducible DNA-binding protein
MYPTRNTLDAAPRGKSIVLLSAALVGALDLERAAKQAHWNVKGPHFMALHELFDKVAQEAEDTSDLVAERLVQLGGTADGRAETVAQRSTLPRYPLDIHHGQAHVDALAGVIAAYGALARDAIDQATGWGDADTADVFTEISRGLDKTLWFVEAHLPVQDSR